MNHTLNSGRLDVSITSLGVRGMEFKSPSANEHRAPSAHSGNMAMSMNSGGSKSWLTMVIVVVAAVVLLGGGMWAYKMMNANAGIKTDKYQALFLTNGQVYFGKLRNINDKYVQLTDIYYLQVQQNVQPADKNNKDQQAQVSLAKLGNELHGPDDRMDINRDQVLFWENLKDDGKVVKAIQDNQKK